MVSKDQAWLNQRRAQAVQLLQKADCIKVAEIEVEAMHVVASDTLRNKCVYLAPREQDIVLAIVTIVYEAGYRSGFDDGFR